MAKFCTKCGKPLEKGKTCSCQEKTQIKKEVTINYKNVAQDYGKLFLELSKGIFIKPVDTIRKNSKKENFVFAIVVLFVSAILSGLLFYCIMKEQWRMTEYGKYFFTVSLEPLFLQTFLKSLLFIIVGIVTVIISMYLISHFVLKSKVDLKEITAMVGICSIFTVIINMITIITSFVSMKLTFMILLISGLLFWIHLYQGMSDVTHIDKNKRAYVFVSIIVIMIFVVFYLLPKVLF